MECDDCRVQLKRNVAVRAGAGDGRVAGLHQRAAGSKLPPRAHVGRQSGAGARLSVQCRQLRRAAAAGRRAKLGSRCVHVHT